MYRRRGSLTGPIFRIALALSVLSCSVRSDALCSVRSEPCSVRSKARSPVRSVRSLRSPQPAKKRRAEAGDPEDTP